MKYLWLGLCLLPFAGIGKNNPTAECRWLYDRIAALEQAIKKGDKLGTQEELSRWRTEFKEKQCKEYDY
ncbi:hypothetical protein JD507_06505 [Aeromonas jandaei]|jgi:hypothetical protein|uniref:hypothetical protein n=1 Tax=Aeromonas jandaei TaxID=650 RepID=UPI00191EDED7|nr:hypothetical protein [Aeromonas jandaei]MBL0544878.1 hypothetical protein [Aeromonas jandaei]WAG08982.1 hypothetical protein NRZ30_07960 [Aeromonas jandaei]